MEKELEIRKLQKKDYRKAWRFAAEAMHFDWYLDNSILLELFSKDFFLSQLRRSTQVIAAYQGDDLAGVLIASFKGEDRLRLPWYHRLFLRAFETLVRVFPTRALDLYNGANGILLDNLLQTENPDGEIGLFASNQSLNIRGVGTMLLEELERCEQGKSVYLFTDDACTWQFYEHRGFVKKGQKDILLQYSRKSIPLKCFLYTKAFAED